MGGPTHRRAARASPRSESRRPERPPRGLVGRSVPPGLPVTEPEGGPRHFGATVKVGLPFLSHDEAQAVGYRQGDGLVRRHLEEPAPPWRRGTITEIQQKDSIRSEHAGPVDRIPRLGGPLPPRRWDRSGSSNGLRQRIGSLSATTMSPPRRGPLLPVTSSSTGEASRRASSILRLTLRFTLCAAETRRDLPGHPPSHAPKMMRVPVD